MSFASPAMLLLLVPLLALGVAWRRPAVAWPCAGIARGVAPSLRRRLAFLPRALALAAAAAIVVALARPQRAVAVADPGAPGVDVEVLLDVSSSMSRRDLGQDRSRLDVARAALERFVRGRDGDRIGLSAFALFPRVVVPRTLDHAALLAMLRDLEPVERDSAEDRTAIGLALASAAGRFEASSAASKVVLLLTDGEQVEHAIGVAEAAHLLAGEGVRLYTVAANPDAGGWRAELDAAASATGGRGFAAGDAAALAETLTAIDALERAPRSPREIERRVPAHAPWLAAAIALLVVQWAMEALWLRRLP